MEKVKKITRSLTDNEYQEVFSAVINNTTSDLSSEDDVELELPSDIGIDSPSLSPHPDINADQINAPHSDEELFVSDDGMMLVQRANERTPGGSDDEIAQLPPKPMKPKFNSVKRRGVTKPRCLDYPENPTSNRKMTSSNFSKTHRGQKRKVPLKTTKDSLLAMEEQRLIDSDGTWIQCCNEQCQKWRYVHDVKEPSSVPNRWFCQMNPDKQKNTCDAPEDDYENMEFVFIKYSFGAIVWAKVDGYPWWPAMVEDDPDVLDYFYTNGLSEFPTHYHVVFLDEQVTRAWVRIACIRPFTGIEADDLQRGINLNHRYRKNIEEAKSRALKALNLTVDERLKRFGFASRYKGRWPKAFDSDSTDEDTSLPIHPGSYHKKVVSPEEDDLVSLSLESFSSLELTPKKKRTNLGRKNSASNCKGDSSKKELLIPSENMEINSMDEDEENDDLVSCKVEGPQNPHIGSMGKGKLKSADTNKAALKTSKLSLGKKKELNSSTGDLDGCNLGTSVGSVTKCTSSSSRGENQVRTNMNCALRKAHKSTGSLKSTGLNVKTEEGSEGKVKPRFQPKSKSDKAEDNALSNFNSNKNIEGNREKKYKNVISKKSIDISNKKSTEKPAVISKVPAENTTSTKGGKSKIKPFFKPPKLPNSSLPNVTEDKKDDAIKGEKPAIKKPSSHKCVIGITIQASDDAASQADAEDSDPFDMEE